MHKFKVTIEQKNEIVRMYFKDLRDEQVRSILVRSFLTHLHIIW